MAAAMACTQARARAMSTGFSLIRAEGWIGAGVPVPLGAGTGTPWSVADTRGASLRSPAQGWRTDRRIPQAEHLLVGLADGDGGAGHVQAGDVVAHQCAGDRDALAGQRGGD